MTAPLFHLDPGSLDAAEPGSTIRVAGPEGHHAATVMRLGAGEAVQLSDTQNRRVGGVVLSADAGELSVQVRTVHDEPVLRPKLVLVQALAKDKRDLQAVESATELGVEAIIPWEADRSVVRWKPGREAKKHAEWLSTVRSSAKQTRRTAIPEVRDLHTTAQYCRLVQQSPGVAAVALHEVEETSLRTALTSAGVLDADPGIEELHLVVGPEGGISDQELTQLADVGTLSARLGRTVLRTSTAGPAAVAAAQLLLGRWDWP
ncbi:16S rRNA (uracil(1498)-N(3))-methyltransferase [Nesterenkonia natronophila]|uniref:Ribosomal RNA small subunit methyltransferase E n=1 Tax=Nesterenkonia natronophila TaxID=2174932 RepID=A0A3A4F0R6_9MICC|nr:16S rRNA (uracil(1498)-N(3))-methyltransferase [Nesterenkonia natronophila]RJN31486.1 16S rRNA (uracil(1498)-N(3))-methyltransferase [Nesterenkonia natronophila]